MPHCISLQNFLRPVSLPKKTQTIRGLFPTKQANPPLFFPLLFRLFWPVIRLFSAGNCLHFFEPFGSAKRPSRDAVYGTTRDPTKSTNKERKYPDMECLSTTMVASRNDPSTATTLPRHTQRADKRRQEFKRA
jgi:hypothetical protein